LTVLKKWPMPHLTKSYQKYHHHISTNVVDVIFPRFGENSRAGTLLFKVTIIQVTSHKVWVSSRVPSRTGRVLSEVQVVHSKSKSSRVSSAVKIYIFMQLSHPDLFYLSCACLHPHQVSPICPHYLLCIYTCILCLSVAS
jgi:hypothetical protein